MAAAGAGLHDDGGKSGVAVRGSAVPHSSREAEAAWRRAQLDWPHADEVHQASQCLAPLAEATPGWTLSFTLVLMVLLM